MAVSTFYAIWEAVDRGVADILYLLDGDCRVVDSIYAVNDVRRLASTLTSED